MKFDQLWSQIVKVMTYVTQIVGWALILFILAVILQQFGWRTQFLPVLDHVALAYLAGAFYLARR